MSVLSSDYQRLQNANVNNNNVVAGYKDAFTNQDIEQAHNIANEVPYLAMTAEKLNDLCDTINYMQQFWDDDKRTFANLISGLMVDADNYDATTTYNTGMIAVYNNIPYFCIENGVTGAFDRTKWLLLVPNSFGINIIGEFDPQSSYVNGDVTYVVNSNIVRWQCYNGSTWDTLGKTYPNIRYLAGEFDAYSNEIYITTWVGD